jgi:hypothetical protein
MQLNISESIFLWYLRISMTENEANHDKSAAIIFDPDTEEVLGRITLVADSMPATEWISTKGPLQGFAIKDGRDHLQQVWVNQDEVLLRTDYGQCFVRIITYPTEGEDQGYLDFTSELQALPSVPSERKTRILTQRGYAFLQSLFSP